MWDQAFLSLWLPHILLIDWGHLQEAGTKQPKISWAYFLAPVNTSPIWKGNTELVPLAYPPNGLSQASLQILVPSNWCQLPALPALLLRRILSEWEEPVVPLSPTLSSTLCSLSDGLTNASTSLASSVSLNPSESGDTKKNQRPLQSHLEGE